MKNEQLRAQMIDEYNAYAYTHNYIMGFIDRGNVYMVECEKSVLPYVIKLDRASRGAGMALRFRPNKAQCETLKNMGITTIVCSVEYFTALCNNSKYNKGEIFEMLVTERMGEEWHKDNVPFHKGADVVAGGVAYQIKFQGATFTNEKALANLRREMA